MFGTEGVRAQINTGPMTAEAIVRLALASGRWFINSNKERTGRPLVVIGKDTRVSGYMVEAALVAGFTSIGMDCRLLGPMPTAGVSYLTQSLRADLGVMISASHNPFHDNGIKLFGPDGSKLADEIEDGISTLAAGSIALSEPTDLGRASRMLDSVGRYVEFAKSTLDPQVRFDGIKVVVDCANGAAYRTTPDTLNDLGAEVIPLAADPDGFNINEGCGAVHPEVMAAAVVAHGADAGIALDGDADRLIICDENGEMIDGDQLMGLIAGDWQRRGLLSAPGIVATVMSNLGLERYLQGSGLSLARTQVGDRYVVEHMRRHGFNLGGEQSGHMVMSDFGTTGDGLVAALQVLAVMKQTERPVSDLCRVFEPVPQILENVRFTTGVPLENEDVMAAIAAGEQKLGNSGRLVIRKSGTEPLIRVMGEGDDAALVQNVVAEIIGSIQSVAA
jgi:phosphoglucosamine mutase